METRISIDIFIWFWLLCLIIFSYSIYYQLVKRDIGFSERIYIFKVSIYMLLLLVFLWFFIDNTIKIYIVSGNYLIGLFWMLCVTLILYMYINIIGLFHYKAKNYQSLVYFSVLLYFALNGFGYLGIKIIIDSDYLLYKTFQTNAVYGIYFILYNIILFLLFYFITILTERDI